MKSRTLTLLIFLCISLYNTTSCVAQEVGEWALVSKKNAISLNVAGTTPFVGITYERLLSNQFNLEVGLGVLSIGAAIKYYPFLIYDNKMVLHLSFGANLFATPFDTFGAGDVLSLIHI